MKNKTFVFTTQNPKASRYLLICLLSFVSIGGISFLPIWALIVLIFGSMPLGFVLFNRHAKTLEKITLYEDYLDSEVFGPVYYETIISARPVTIDTGEGLRLKLQSKKKVWWKAIKTEELAIYDAFVNALAEAVSHADLSQIKSGHPKTPDQQEVPFDREEEASTEKPQLLAEEANVGEEISQVQHRNQNAGNAKTILLIFVGILLAFYGLFKIYAPKWEQQRNEREMAPIREALSTHMEQTASLEDSVHQVIQEHTKANGPYLLWSNDTTAQLTYVPIMQMHPSETGIVSLVNTELSDQLEVFLAQPDSVPWAMAMKNERTSFYLKTRWPALKDTTTTYFYIGLEDATVNVPNPNYDPRLSGQRVPDSVSFQSALPVMLRSKKSLKKDIDLRLSVPLRFMEKHSSTVHFYVAARVGEGQMSRALFDKIVDIIKTEMVDKVKIEPTGYHFKVFNKKD